ncbi:O-antigen ligase family protein [Saccharospirillum impatiens]|uniref:O-antigen ligase family protein n=1 Tax=Saccharospirillum impatiens TaxID=169438 RepID=UPI0003F94942|nr:O-antigen ligase family protein [Saccharospirillum impatiens]
MKLYDKGALAPFLLAVVILLGTTLANIAGPFASYDRQRWLLLVLMGVLALFSVARKALLIQAKARLLVGCWVGFISFLTLSTVTATLAGSDWALFDLLLWVLFSLTVTGLIQSFTLSPDVIQNVCKVLVAVWGSYYLIVIMNFMFVMVSPFSWDIHVLTQHAFINVRFFNQLQVLLFPLMLALACGPSGRWSKLGLFSAVFTVALILYSSARGAAVAMFIESLLIMYLTWKFRGRALSLKFVRRWVVILAFGLVTYIIFLDLIPAWRFGESVGATLMRESTSGRWGMWSELLSAMTGHWLFGHGGFSYADKSAGIGTIFGHPHNSLLQLLYEYGLLATLCFTLFSIGLFVRVLKALGQSDSVYLPYLLASAVGGAALSLVSGVIVMPLSQLLLMVIVAALWQSSQLKSEAVIKLKVGFHLRIIMFALVSLLIVTVFSLAWHSYINVMSGETLKFDVGPRFWLIGRMV